MIDPQPVLLPLTGPEVAPELSLLGGSAPEFKQREGGVVQVQARCLQDVGAQSGQERFKYGQQLPSMHSTMHLYPINGAAHRAGCDETAFSYRDANFASVIVGVDPNPANNDRIVQWAKDYWLALHTHSAGGGYINMMMDEGNDNVKASYRDNYPRLAEIKRKYDPANLFRVNQNIRPA
jgi:hypothetical protein